MDESLVDISVRVCSEFSDVKLSSSFVLFLFLLSDDEGEFEGSESSSSSLSLTGMVRMGWVPCTARGLTKFSIITEQ